MPLIFAIATYIADKIVSQFIKEEGYGRLKKFFFPTKKYVNRLSEIISDSITDFEKEFPVNSGGEKFPFYHSQILYDLLNQHILFKTSNSPLVIEEFRKNENILTPNKEELERFYSIFIKKVNADKILKKLHFDENYKSEIFEISSDIKKLLSGSEIILDKITKMESDVGATKFQMQQLKNRFENPLQVQNIYKPQGLSVFPQIEKTSGRKIFVEEILENLQHFSWVFVYGNISMGKTQLAVLIAEKFPDKFWVTLTGLNSKIIIDVILKELSLHFNHPTSSLEDITTLISMIPKGSLIVLDDMPKMDLSKNDWIRLKHIVEQLKIQNVRLLSTSNFLLQAKIKNYIPESAILEKPIPYLNENEVSEILLAYGASSEEANALKTIIRNTAEGHPVIVNAICAYLKSLNWDISEENIIEIFRGKYTTDLDDDTYERIIKTVSDSDSKDLLYRLKIVSGKITDEEIDTVSAINPNISHPFEKITSLSGLWLQKVKINNYELSPLIKRIKNHNLSPTLYRLINNALAKQILLKKKIDQIEANKVILYFINAQSYNEAGFVLSVVLEESLNNSDLFFDWGFSLYWSSTELPEGMDLFLKSVIRYLQINIFLKKKDENIDFLVSDLEKITIESAEKNINVAHAALLLSTVLSDTNAEKSTDFLLLAVTHLEQIKIKDSEELFTDLSFSVESLVWNSLLKVKNAEEFDRWLFSFSKLSTTQQEKSLRGELNQICCLLFCSKQFDQYAIQKNANWNLLIEQYEQIIQKISAYNIPVLTACCVKFQIRCYCSKLNDTRSALNLFQTHYDLLNGNFIIAFLLYDELGRQLYYVGQSEKALPYLLEASVIETPSIFTEKIDTYIALSEIFSNTDLRVAHEFAEKAYNAQQGNQFVDDIFAAKVIGEYAISLWQIKQGKDVFNILEKGLEKILYSYKPLADYQGTIIRYGHIINYYYHILAKRPLQDIDGQPYAVPFRGAFSKSNEKLLEGGYYFEQRKFMLAYLLVQAFEFTNDLSLAKKWAYICFNLNKESSLNPFASLMTGMNTYLILENKFEEAVVKEIEILKTVNELNSGSDIAEKVDSPRLIEIVKDRPRTTFKSFDHILFEYVVSFIVIKGLWNYLLDGREETIKNFLDIFQVITEYFENKEPLLILENGFKYLINEEKTSDDILLLLNEQNELATQVRLLLYLIASCKTNAKKALKLHLGLIQKLEMISSKVASKAPYEFIVLPFFFDYWNAKISKNKGEFFQPDFLLEKGLPQVDQVVISQKLKKLFNVLCYHLEIEPDAKVEAWLNN